MLAPRPHVCARGARRLYCNRTSTRPCFEPTLRNMYSRTHYHRQRRIVDRKQVGLFFYDIFWVFGTDVMVTVATKFDAPIKLLFPRALATDDSAAVLQMLGLGDIVMPGLFIALLLRYDFHKAAGIGTRSMSGNEQLSKRETMAFDKPYFNICILAYVMGLILTVFVMYTFKHAQPALLYLVPACLGAGVVTAIARGELFAFLSFSEEVEEKDPKQKE